MESPPHEESPRAGASSTALPRRGFDQDTNPSDTETGPHLFAKQEQGQDRPMVYYPRSSIYGKLPTRTSIRLIDLDASCIPCLFICDICENQILNVVYRCGICIEGDFDLCGPCKDDGADCLDHHHALIQRTLNNGTENPMMELSYCMHTFDLDAPVPFRALSYTWDSPYLDVLTGEPIVQPEVPRYVSCNMTLLPVKQNLHDALKTFKEVGIGGLLWVDALCINQGDLDERAAQVALMGQLYSMAADVLIWLGPPEQGFKDLVWATKEFMPAYVGHLQSSTGASPNSILDPSWDKFLGLKGVSTKLQNMALFYASCRWFTRAWVAQEVTLAKYVVILCGPGMLRFDDLSLLVELFFNRFPVGFSQICSSLHRHLSEKGYKRKLPFTFFSEVAHWTAFSSSDTNGGEWCLGLNGDLSWLWDLIHVNRDAQCADDRDHIYSILGMAATKFMEPTSKHLIIPDYNIATEELFTTVTKRVLERTKSLDILSYQRGGREHCRRSGLPSWVADYAQPIDYTTLDGTDGRYENFDAALCNTFIAEMHTVSMSTLACSGALFGVVTVGAKMDDAISNKWTLKEWETFFKFCGCAFPGTDSDAIFEKLWRTLIFDCTHLHQTPAPTTYKEHFLDFLRMLFFAHLEPQTKWSTVLYRQVRAFGLSLLRNVTRSEDSEGISAQIQTLLELVRTKESRKLLPYGSSERSNSLGRVSEFGIALVKAAARCMFKTERSHLGLGPYNMQEGDQVWVLFNTRIPFILRPTGKANEFTLVGDCYMHGFMHGEMLDDEYGLKERIERINIV